MYKKIFSIAIPMILSAISIPLLGIVDTAILGHLDNSIYLAGINIGTTVFNVLFWGFGFLKMSTTGLISQSFGEKKPHKINLQLNQALFISLIIAAFLLIFQNPIGTLAIKLSSVGGDSAQLARIYFDIRIFSAPATLLLYVLFGYFLAIGQAHKILLLMLINQFGNMILDYLFVIHLHWGIKGVAFGSVFSEYAAVILGFVLLILSGYQFPSTTFIKDKLLNKQQLKRFFVLNRDIFIRTFCLITVFTMMTKGSAQLGNLTLAANAILMNFFYLMSYGLDGFAHAVESLCGQAYGAKKIKELKLILKNVFLISMIIAGGFSLIYLLFGSETVRLLTSIKEVQNYATQYVIWLVIIPLIAMPSFVYDGFFIATTDAKIMRNSMVLATVFCYIPLWYYLRPFGNHGLWMAFFSFFVVRSFIIHIYYLSWINSWEITLKK